MAGRFDIHAAATVAQHHCSGRHSLLCLLPVIQRHLPKPFTGGEELTRDYRCRTIEELADLLLVRIEHDVPIEVEGDVYIKRPTVRVQHFPGGGSCLIAMPPG